MKRWLAIAAVVGMLGSGGLLGGLGCGPAADKPTEYPSLEPAQPDAPVDIPEAPVPDLAEFARPASQPSGAPVTITWAPPVVGATWTRVVDEESLYSTTWLDGKHDKRRQRTVRRFEIVERVAKLRGSEIGALEVTVKDGHEATELDGPARLETLLSGDYLIEAAEEPGGALVISRGGTGFSMGDREREELHSIYGGEVGQPSPLVALLRGRALRVGETIELDEDGKRALAGGEPLPVPMYFGLVALDGGVATFQIVFSSHETIAPSDDDAARGVPAGTDTRGVRIAIGIEVATGRTRRLLWIDARGDTSPTSRSASRSTIETVLTY